MHDHMVHVVQVHIYMQVNMHVYVYIYVDARGQPKMTLVRQNPKYFLRQDLLLAWNAPNTLNYLATEPQAFSYLYLSSAQIAST